MNIRISQQGATLAETVVIIAIVALLVVVVGLPFLRFRQQQALQNTTNAVIAVLNEARTKTLAAVNNTTYSVRLESDRVILFSGTTYNSADSTNQITIYESPITAQWNLQPTPGTTNVISFTRLTGATTNSGTITLSIPGGATRTVTIDLPGTITRS